MKACASCGAMRRVSKTSAATVTCRDCRRRRQVREHVPTLKVIRPDDRPRDGVPPAPVGELLQSLDESLGKARWVIDSDPATTALARALAREIDESLGRWEVVYAELRVLVEDAQHDLDARDAQTLLRLMRKLVACDHPMQVLGTVATRYREVLKELGLSPAGRKGIDMNPRLPFDATDAVDDLQRRLKARRTAWNTSND